jgi:gluconolactonase
LRRLDPPNTLSDFLLPPPQTKYNGNILDLQERLVSCECGSNGLKVVMTTNGVISPLVTDYHGFKFYSPNDVCVKSDGSIWFTDPGYDSGLPLPPPVPPGFQPGLYVYRFYETNGNATVLAVITNVAKPNGICLSPDETKLYVADNGVFANQGTIKVFTVTSSNTVTGGATFCTVSSGLADGFRCDADGRIWSSAGDGVEIFAPDGHLIGKILMTRTANLCFGGPQYKTLYMVGQPYVSSFPVLVAGAVSTKKLAVSSDGNQVNVCWPAPSTGFGLQSSETLAATAVWSDVADQPQVTNGLNQVSVDPTNAAAFFRLRLP